jgi:hypothetical protein
MPLLHAFHMLKTASVVVALGLLAGAALIAAPLTVRDLDGHAWTPLQPKAGEISLLLFVSAECPISNRYAPELDRLASSYRAKHVQTFLVYTDQKATNEAVRASVREFHPGSPAAVVIDQGLRLVASVGATVTPEAAVFTGQGRVYRGRIDDLYLNAGQSRRAASRHDLRDALDAVLAGARVAQPETRAVGCYIEGERVRG